MTRRLGSLFDIADAYDLIVFDQWGVLHNGTRPYGQAVATVAGLHAGQNRLAVLSNSGKRGDENARRLEAMGFDRGHFDPVMTSGEALWQDMAAGRIPERLFFPMERAPGDAAAWARGLDVRFTDTVAEAEALLLMGLPDDAAATAWEATLAAAGARGMTAYCSNPDVHSPRADGLVASPGAVARAYEKNGGTVYYYGKPHRPVFDALSPPGTARVLMIGDSLAHDIKGAAGVGWDSVLIEGGLLAGRPMGDADLEKMLVQHKCPPPTYRMETLA
ncbi:MAG: TIGR01459 family HAD-type hydrolase [Pseudomonadota bacterium]